VSSQIEANPCKAELGRAQVGLSLQGLGRAEKDRVEFS